MIKQINLIKKMWDIYMRKNIKVAVIFDLDETIGHFWQIGKLWEGLKILKGNKFGEKDFNEILDMFPYVFRPGIFNVFKYLKAEKIKDKRIKVIIYSNNQGTPKWANMIKKYIEKKINYKLFDKVITAWKVDGKIYEKCRRTNEKTYSEIVRCGKLNKKTQIYFVDDAYHPRMYNKNTDYFHIKPWQFAYNIEYIVNKIIRTHSGKKIKEGEKVKLKIKLIENIKNQNWGNIRYTNGDKPNMKDKQLGKELLIDIKNFLRKNNKKTLRRRVRGYGTRKR